MAEALRILLVDDEKRILEMFGPLLEDLGFHVKTAPDAAGAEDLVSREKFDIAFLDRYLGPDNGLDLMRKLALIDGNLYFSIITGNSNTDLAIEAMKLGASDYVSKPFFLADLAKSIDFIRKKMDIDMEKEMVLRNLERKMSEKTEELNCVYFSVLSTLAQAMEKRDIGTFGHCRRVSYYTGMIADAVSLGKEERENLKAASMLHDIGKIGISDFILGKEGPLTPEERDIVRSHPGKGVEILKPLKQFKSILPTILQHHENFDGSGYPYGLSGEEICLHARIIAVADTYDAIMSDRPYRSRRGHEVAIGELIKGSGTQFDSSVVKAFVDMEIKYSQLFRGGQGFPYQAALDQFHSGPDWT